MPFKNLWAAVLVVFVALWVPFAAAAISATRQRPAADIHEPTLLWAISPENSKAHHATAPVLWFNRTIVVASPHIHELNGTTGVDVSPAKLSDVEAQYTPMVSPRTPFAPTTLLVTGETSIVMKNMHDGATIWSRQMCGRTAGPSVFASDQVAFGCAACPNGESHCDFMSSRTGVSVGQLKVDGNVTFPPIVFGSSSTALFAAVTDRTKLTVFDTLTFTQRWRFNRMANIDRPPVVSTDTKPPVIIFANTFDAKIYALRGTDGATMWTFRRLEGTEPTGVIVDPDRLTPGRTAYAGYRSTYALRVSSGDVNWEAATCGTHEECTSRPLKVFGSILFVYVSHDCLLVAVNTTDGSIMWHAAVGGHVHDDLMLSSNEKSVIFSVTYPTNKELDGVRNVDIATGELRYHYPVTSRTHIGGTSDGGVLYFTAMEDRRVTVFALKDNS